MFTYLITKLYVRNLSSFSSGTSFSATDSLAILCALQMYFRLD